jgi:hypothetical protein
LNEELPPLEREELQVEEPEERDGEDDRVEPEDRVEPDERDPEYVCPPPTRAPASGAPSHSSANTPNMRTMRLLKVLM